MCHEPHIALGLYLPPITTGTLDAGALGHQRTVLDARGLQGPGSNLAGSASWGGWAMQSKRTGHQGIRDRLGGRELSLVACGAREGVVSRTVTGSVRDHSGLR